jgi:pyridoxine kinase
VKVLSIQSSVAYGHVGNSAAVFPLQRIGVEVWPVSTVVFSNHTGYGDWGGPVLSPDDVTAVLRGVEARGAFAEVDAVLSGYQGSAGMAAVVLDAVAQVKAANPGAIYACDPVMGNARSGCFVHPDIPPLIRDRVVPYADLLTPNQFELGFLTGTEPHSLDDTLAAVDALRDAGPTTVLVTSVERSDADPETIEMLAVDDRGDGVQAWLVSTPRLPFKANGSGDVTAALFTAHLWRTRSPQDALERTAASVFDLLARTLTAGGGELALVEAQDVIAEPDVRFRARRVR